jgi:hypothetical protein
MRNNGFRLYGRAFNSTSTDALPARFEIQVGKGHLGWNVFGFGSAGKLSGSEIDHKFFSDGVLESGVQNYYNPSTGILSIDAGSAFNSSTTRYVGGNPQGPGYVTNGYFFISASKNPALVGIRAFTGRLLRVVRFPASGTWNKGPETKYIVVKGVGGGGGGGSLSSGYGGGGGGGGSFEKFIDNPPLSVAVTIGAGGGAASGGGATTFASFCTGNGGNPGVTNNGQPGLGGTASGGDINARGNGGTIGYGAGGFGGPGSGGGSAFFGGGGANGVGTASGEANTGGGGNGVGGSGGSGFVIVYEYN